MHCQSNVAFLSNQLMSKSSIWRHVSLVVLEWRCVHWCDYELTVYMTCMLLITQWETVSTPSYKRNSFLHSLIWRWHVYHLPRLLQDCILPTCGRNIVFKTNRVRTYYSDADGDLWWADSETVKTVLLRIWI
jgi:hypothetical protein